MALSADGLGRQLTGLPENYAFVSAQVPVADADAAAARAADSLHLTNDFSGLFYQDTSVDEVHWITDLDATQQPAGVHGTRRPAQQHGHKQCVHHAER